MPTIVIEPSSATGPAIHKEGAAMELSNIRNCARCGFRYDWRRSPSSSLKMTYCGNLCEQADLGFSIEGILHGYVIVPQATADAWRLPTAA